MKTQVQRLLSSNSMKRHLVSELQRDLRDCRETMEALQQSKDSDRGMEVRSPAPVHVRSPLETCSKEALRFVDVRSKYRRKPLSQMLAGSFWAPSRSDAS